MNIIIQLPDSLLNEYTSDNELNWIKSYFKIKLLLSVNKIINDLYDFDNDEFNIDIQLN